jgi:hypothetical protein
MQTKVAIGLIVLAVSVALIPSLPYGYYPMMRWFVSASGAWLAVASHRRGLEGWTWCWAVAAGIYNPIVPVHSTREIWSIVNVATVVVAGWYGVKISFRDGRN